MPDWRPMVRRKEIVSVIIILGLIGVYLFIVDPRIGLGMTNVRAGEGAVAGGPSLRRGPRSVWAGGQSEEFRDAVAGNAVSGPSARAPGRAIARGDVGGSPRGDGNGDFGPAARGGVVGSAPLGRGDGGLGPPPRGSVIGGFVPPPIGSDPPNYRPPVISPSGPTLP